MLRINLISLLIIIAEIANNAADFLCTDDFCSYYLEKNECMSTSVACNVQNKTESGEFFPGEVPCGCCKVCLENLNEGDPCTQGSPDVTPPMLVCGPGLYCKYNETNSGLTCQKMNHTKCFQEQTLYDERMATGEIGLYMHRPQCDGDGNFLSVKCNLGQSCFCVNESGERIFGEAPYTLKNELTMKCECSRMNDKFRRNVDFKFPILTARCQEDGSYDPLQCMDGKCICVEPETGSPSSEVTLITKSDYNRMSCFNRKMHLDYKYLYDCEDILTDLSQEIQAAENQHFNLLGYEMPQCQPDGWFSAIQADETMFFCADKYKQKIDNFEARQGTPEALTMNCKCARTLLLLRKNKSIYLPQCTPNGNFEKVQCRDGMCYCVDEDGLQLTKETPMTVDLEC